MPCESCNIQFTVFRRKRTCSDCKRFYCSNCLSSPKRSYASGLCERCTIFAKRPLLRADLLQLKPKDLIFYLQSKHISTTGCVEKDELVGLVLAHVQQTDMANDEQREQSERYEGDSNHFDNLRQTCQNFFTNITVNITEGLNPFDAKPRTNVNGNNQRSSPLSPQGSTQGVFTREIPTYARFQGHMQNTQPPPVITSPPSNNTSSRLPMPATPSQSSIFELPTNSSSSSGAHRVPSQSQSSRTVSPVVSTSSFGSHPTPAERLERLAPPTAILHDPDDCTLSDCECNDDELYETFYGRGNSRVASSRILASTDRAEPTPTPTPGDVESSQSSFEELGAIGGISDDSKTTTDTNSSIVDQWQLLDVQRSMGTEHTRTEADDTNGDGVGDGDSHGNGNADADENRNVQSEDNFSQLATSNSGHMERPSAPHRTRRVTRRRSDSHLRRVRPQSEDDELLSPTTVPPLMGPSNRLCSGCGKHRFNIKRRVEKMRNYLENAQMSEEDIKQELQDFLVYLEQRIKSMDYSGSETTATPATPLSVPAVAEEPELDDNEGIHVYAGSTDNLTTKDSRFINLDDIQTMDELEGLTVKQLKEVLMLNRVDYKGCCEKQELLDRVCRLWRNRKSTPAVDKLAVDELCKICMDAPIECVILECGHMATCTNCGKVLSECPICRQYIVRVVRFFRA